MTDVWAGDEPMFLYNSSSSRTWPVDGWNEFAHSSGQCLCKDGGQ